MAQATVPMTIYHLKVTLLETRPSVWRSLQVPGEVTLARLHRVLQVTMGWEDYHLHEFRIDGQEYGPPAVEGGMPVINEQRVRLKQAVATAPAQFLYIYDFGDYWQHLIEVEHISPPVPQQRYPVCLDGKRACPPEDAGGTPGFAHFLQVIKNPRHREHKELLEWVGGAFDPTVFARLAVNRQLARLR